MASILTSTLTSTSTLFLDGPHSGHQQTCGVSCVPTNGRCRANLGSVGGVVFHVPDFSTAVGAALTAPNSCDHNSHYLALPRTQSSKRPTSFDRPRLRTKTEASVSLDLSYRQPVLGPGPGQVDDAHVWREGPEERHPRPAQRHHSPLSMLGQWSHKNTPGPDNCRNVSIGC